MLWKSLVTFSLLLAGSAVTAEKTITEQTRYDDVAQNGDRSGGYSGGSDRIIGGGIGGGYDTGGTIIDVNRGHDGGSHSSYSDRHSISHSGGYSSGKGFAGAFVSGSGNRYGNNRGGGHVSIKSTSRDRYGNVKVIHKAKSFRGSGYAGISIKHHGHHGDNHHNNNHGRTDPWKRDTIIRGKRSNPWIWRRSSTIRRKRSNPWIWKRSHRGRRSGRSRWGNYW